jgi:hypothetical protein
MGNGIEQVNAAAAGRAAQAVQSSPTDAARAKTSATVHVPVGAIIRMKSGARWFYWVAGLSLVNMVMAFGGSHLHFVLGLGTTQLVAAVAKSTGPAAAMPAVVIDFMIAGMFVLLGMWAGRCNQTAFLIGMVLYAADGALLLLAHDWLSAGFHVLALIFMYRGFAAAQQLKGIAELGRVAPI